MSIVVPAVLPASYADLKEKLELFSAIGSVERIQIDVVDGRFATPASWPYTAPDEFRKMVKNSFLLPHLNRIEYEIDLMCLDAESAVSSWLALGATRLTFHAESTRNLPRLLATARSVYGDEGVISFGLAVNVASDLALIEPCLAHIQYVQCMGINRIGRQGQPFDPRVYEKVRVFHSRHPALPLQVDGGVSFESAEKLLSLGVSNLVIGSGILKAGNPAEAVAAFENLQNPFGV